MDSSSVRLLEQQLLEAGNRLRNELPSCVDELLNLLDRIEQLLATVEQQPSNSMKVAILPAMKALSALELLRHSNTDVRVTVAACMSEITRITAPDAPYNDNLMKEIFQLTVAAYEKLSNVSTRSYAKALSMLDNAAKVRSCLVMLDLECDTLIIEMFQHFLKTIRSSHPHAVFLAMETVMSLIIEESEEISLDLLITLLASIRKENQNTSPVSWKLAEKVVTNCATKLKPYLIEAVGSKRISFNDYAEIVTSICQNGSDTIQHDHVSGSEKNLVTTSENATTINDDPNVAENSSKPLEDCHSNGSAAHDELASSKNDKSEAIPRKRGRRPNSMMNPDEGYEYWSHRERKSRKPRQKKSDKGSVLIQDPHPNSLSTSAVHVKEEPEIITDPQEEQQRKSVLDEDGTNINENLSSLLTDIKKRRRREKTSGGKDETKPKRKRAAVKQEASEMPDLDGGLVGHRIKVWWPIDKIYYDGVVDSYEPRTKMHMILYADGESETLNLKNEQWEIVDDLPNRANETDLPNPDASSDTPMETNKSAKSESPKHKKAGSSSKRKQTRSRKQTSNHKLIMDETAKDENARGERLRL